MIAFDDLPPVHAVLLSTATTIYDQMDLTTLDRLRDRDVPIMAMPLGNDAIIRRAIPEARVVVGVWGDCLTRGHGMTITLTRANHWANRHLRDVRMALWAGHWLHTPVGSIWFVGDTGYGDGTILTDLRRRFGAPDVALIPIGAYEPRWFMAAQYVNPKEAVRIFDDVAAGHGIGMHWGTFRLTNEGRETPRATLAVALNRAAIDARRFEAAEPGAVSSSLISPDTDTAQIQARP